MERRLGPVAILFVALNACSDQVAPELAATSDRAWTLVESHALGGVRQNAEALTADVLDRRPGIDTIFTHEAEWAFRASRALVTRGRRARIVTIGDLDDRLTAELEMGRIAGVIHEPTHAAYALDLATLAAIGIEPARRDYELGVRTISAADVQFGGIHEATDAEQALVEFLKANASHLSQVVQSRFLRIGVSTPAHRPRWRHRFLEETVARSRTNVVDVELEFADESLDQRAGLEKLAERPIDAIVIAPRDAATARLAVERFAGKPVVIVGPPVDGLECLCSLHTPAHAFGHAAAELLRDIARSGRILELRGSDDSGHGLRVHQGFLESLGMVAAPTSPPR